MIDLKQGDCLELMKDIPDESIDMVLADLPYGTTDNKWDNTISFDLLWKQYKRIIKDRGCIALFGQDPFSSKLRLSNEKMYRYDWIWYKTRAMGFFQVHSSPLRSYENISIFYKHLPTYNPQMREGFKPYYRKGTGKPKSGKNYQKSITLDKGRINKDGTRYPINIIKFSNPNNHTIHPTQKPVPLLEYLIKTYTNEGEVVLDNCMGSGSTGVAAVNLNRDFIGYELEQDYFDIATKRINEAIKDHE